MCGLFISQLTRVCGENPSTLACFAGVYSSLPRINRLTIHKSTDSGMWYKSVNFGMFCWGVLKLAAQRAHRVLRRGQVHHELVRLRLSTPFRVSKCQFTTQHLSIDTPFRVSTCQVTTQFTIHVTRSCPRPQTGARTRSSPPVEGASRQFTTQFTIHITGSRPCQLLHLQLPRWKHNVSSHQVSAYHIVHHIYYYIVSSAADRCITNSFVSACR